MTTDRYVRMPELLANYVPVSPATLWRWVKAGQFPAPISLGPRVRAWDVQEVLRWIDARKAGASGGAELKGKT